MPTYNPPIDEFVFLLHDVLGVQDRTELPGYADLTPDLTRQVLEGAGNFVRDVWHPINRSGDEEGCVVENGVVRTPAGFKAAYERYCEAGWNRLQTPERFGGAGLPGILAQPVYEMSSSSNASLAHYPALTNGAQRTLAITGADWMRDFVVPQMVSGQWCGTMCLTEPHCGTDLKLMTTKAVPQADGTYLITGTKIFISGGDHDLTENIVHLVLAKLPDETGAYSDDLGTVSLFMVPKVLVDSETGEMGPRNGVSIGGIEHKMGIKGSATCVLNFDDAVGHRLGAAKADTPGSKSTGMSGMFHMMNHARLGTGISALAAAEAAYQNAADYARERRSGRAVEPSDRTAGSADPIIVHPDVRRMLLQQRAFIEGARCAALWTSMLLEEEHAAPDLDRRAGAGLLGGLLTPVIKAYFSDQAFASANAAMQVFGGHGYIREHGVEQYVRDARIFQLYEGANGIQALDLVGRKMTAGGGRGVLEFFAELETQASAVEAASPDLAPYAEGLRAARSALQEVAVWLQKTAPGKPALVGAASYDVLTMFGVTLLGMMWARIATTVSQMRARGDGDRGLLERKLILARYWFEREMPQLEALRRRATAGADGLMALAADAF